MLPTSAAATPVQEKGDGVRRPKPDRSGQDSSDGVRRLFLGTYTSAEGGGKGLGLATYDEESGLITSTGTLTGVENPSFLALHPDGRTLYTVNEQEQGGVTAVRLAAGGQHQVLGTRSTGGAGPCHSAPEREVAAQRQLHLGQRRRAPHHGRGRPRQPYRPRHPRHPTAGPVVCGYDPPSGRLTPGEPQSTGTGSGTSYPAQLLVTSDGAFAYLANRGHNSLTRYAVQDDGAKLRLLGTVPVGGDFPRHITFSPSGGLLFASNQKSGRRHPRSHRSLLVRRPVQRGEVAHGPGQSAASPG